MSQKSSRRRRLPRVALAFATLAVSAGSFTVPANAYVKLGHLQNWASGGCLTSTADGLVVSTASCQNVDAQLWTVTGPVGMENGSEVFNIKNKANGRYLWIGRLHPCNAHQCYEPAVKTVVGTGEEETRVTARGPGWYDVTLLHHYYPNGVVPFPSHNICLDSVGIGSAYAWGPPMGNSGQYDCNYGTYQTWRLIP
ncbi:RICIN domain-containing protein [Kribbella sp. NPDC056861]|uniref:RICIN domain-containing protein n=1 Tax=Kribbella sp. NPDC056861 TaxID=3154857 RepID=UPI00343E9765